MTGESFQQYQSAVLNLPKQKQLAFCCACCEHVLPFFEYFRYDVAPRELLNTLWQAALEADFNQPELEDMIKRTSLVIPNIGEEDDMPSEIAMRASIGVLESVDVLNGKSEAAIRAASSPLDVLQLVHLHIGEPVHPDFELFEVIDNASIVPREIGKEWKILNELLSEVSLKDLSADWKLAQQDRGNQLLALYTPRFPSP